MRNLLYIIAAMVISLSACKTKPNAHKPAPSGKAGVMVIVMNDSVKKSQGGKMIWDIMVQPMLGLPQEEPMFDASVIPYRSFSDFMKTYRNIIIVEVGPKVKEGIKFYKETWAREQALVKVFAKDTASLKTQITENELKLVGFFTKAERDRLSKFYAKTFSKTMTDLMKENYDYVINVPREFSLRKRNDKILWMSHETASSSLGIITYQIDYVGEGSFSKEYLLNKRYEVLKDQVPGPSEGSYMTTEPQFPVSYQVINTPNDKNVVELRGLWRVEGDMMGGPFISYSHLNKETNKITVTEGYVYNPIKPNKRNMMRQLEAVLRTYKPIKKTAEIAAK